jgi:hypothetical protein
MDDRLHAKWWTGPLAFAARWISLTPKTKLAFADRWISFAPNKQN